MNPSTAEWTPRAIAAGVVFGILFGAANAYLGLRVGMTVSTSIPVAIMTVAVLRALRVRASLLEINLSQTIGSASTSLATGAIFTLPALYLWGTPPSYGQVVVLTLLGGLLGVAAMIPLRHLLIVRSADELAYPEGTACAEVLQSAGHGESRARGGVWIGIGLGVGVAIKLVVELTGWVPGSVSAALPGLPNAMLSLELAPALIGVGYILGYRQSGVLVAGSLLAAVVLIPLITMLGARIEEIVPPGSMPIAAMDADAVWASYVRYIGAGAVTAAGIATVIRGLPAMVQSFVAVAASFRPGEHGSSERIDRDLPGWVVVAIIMTVVAVVMFVPGVTGELSALQRMVTGAAVGVCGIIFVAVMSRIAGIVGTSSQPTSGVTIVTILAVGAIFAAAGWTMPGAKVAVLCVGAIVAIAASSAGDTSQDLKTGRLVGATPARQQLGQFIGAMTSCWAVAGTLLFLGSAYQFGSTELPAPQATLIATLVEGTLDGTLPWQQLLLGAGLAVAAMLAGVSGLAFAIGLYLPLSAMLPIFVGGCVRGWVEWRRRGRVPAIDGGVLLGSGLVAGEGLAGVAVAGLVGAAGVSPVGTSLGAAANIAIAVVLLGLLAYLLTRAGADRRLDVSL